jgi:hypothetical protein
MRKKEFDTFLQIRVTRNLLEDFKQHALSKNKTISECLREYMRAIVRKELRRLKNDRAN